MKVVFAISRTTLLLIESVTDIMNHIVHVFLAFVLIH